MARARTTMTKILEILRLRKESGLSQHKVSQASGCSLGTVNKVLKGAAKVGLEWPLQHPMTEQELQERIFGGSQEARTDPRREGLNFAAIHKQLQARQSLTIRLVWEEYRAAEPDGYGYSQFCHLYRQWREQHKVSMAQEHKAGESAFVDYAGSTVTVHPPDGDPWEAEIFSAVLGASSYFYCEACRGQDLASWIGAHVRALTFFEGAPACVVPDNLKSGVTKADLYEPTVNATYLEMARHYHMAVLPARPGRPRDNLKDSLNPPSQLWRLAT